ncbi:hypothetical protein T484DRAFT_3648385, partial [Baffinella frigidus]
GHAPRVGGPRVAPPRAGLRAGNLHRAPLRVVRQQTCADRKLHLAFASARDRGPARRDDAHLGLSSPQASSACRSARTRFATRDDRVEDRCCHDRRGVHARKRASGVSARQRRSKDIAGWGRARDGFGGSHGGGEGGRAHRGAEAIQEDDARGADGQERQDHAPHQLRKHAEASLQDVLCQDNDLRFVSPRSSVEIPGSQGRNGASRRIPSHVQAPVQVHVSVQEPGLVRKNCEELVRGNTR